MAKKYFGYVYKTTNVVTGRFYIGKKNYSFRRKKKLTKKELAEFEGRKGRKPKFKYIEYESDWKTYLGSSKALLDDVKQYGVENFKVKVLKKCESSASLRYWEEYYQFKLGVLFKDTYNDNIGGRFYRGKVHE